MVVGVCDERFDCTSTSWVSSYTVGNTWLYHHNYGSFWKDGNAVGRVAPIANISNGSVVGIIVDLDKATLVFTLDGKPQGKENFCFVFSKMCIVQCH